MKYIMIVAMALSVSACNNKAFVAGMAKGLAEIEERKKYGSSYDSVRAAREAKEALKEAEKARRELENLKADLRFKCITTGGVMVGTKCMY